MRSTQLLLRAACVVAIGSTAHAAPAPLIDEESMQERSTINARTEAASAGAATCHLSYAYEGATQIRMYDIHLGAPHDNGVGCAETLAALQAVTTTDPWRCEVLIKYNNNTRLYFAATPLAADDQVGQDQQHDDIMLVVQGRYPDVPFLAAGYCSLPDGNARRGIAGLDDSSAL